MNKYILTFFSVVLFLVSQACSHKKNVKLDFQKNLESKKIALADIQGPPKERAQIEIALVNEIVTYGRFQIIDRATVQNAMVHFPHQSDWKRLGEKIDANYILSIDILDSTIQTHEGYQAVQEENSVLQEEWHTKKPVQAERYEKVKSEEATIKIQFKFFNVSSNKIEYEDIIKLNKTINLDSHKKTLQFSKMHFTEELYAEAIHSFFEKIENNSKN